MSNIMFKFCEMRYLVPFGICIILVVQNGPANGLKLNTGTITNGLGSNLGAVANGLGLNSITDLGSNLGAANVKIDKQTNTYEYKESSNSNDFNNGFNTGIDSENLQFGNQFDKAQNSINNFASNDFDAYTTNLGSGKPDLQNQFSKFQSNGQGFGADSLNSNGIDLGESYSDYQSQYNNALNTDIGIDKSQFQNQFNKAQNFGSGGLDTLSKQVGTGKSDLQHQFSKYQSIGQGFGGNGLSSNGITDLGGANSQKQFNKAQNFGSSGLDTFSKQVGTGKSDLQNQFSNFQSNVQDFGGNILSPNGISDIGGKNLQNQLDKAKTITKNVAGSGLDKFPQNFGPGISDFQNQFPKPQTGLKNSDYDKLTNAYGDLGAANSQLQNQYSQTYDFSTQTSGYNYDSNQDSGSKDKILNVPQPQIKLSNDGNQNGFPGTDGLNNGNPTDFSIYLVDGSQYGKGPGAAYQTVQTYQYPQTYQTYGIPVIVGKQDDSSSDSDSDEKSKEFHILPVSSPTCGKPKTNPPKCSKPKKHHPSPKKLKKTCKKPKTKKAKKPKKESKCGKKN